MDTARGIGIILVVYGHTLRGQVTSGAFLPSWHAGVQDDVIYSFHMPLFFFLAGLFFKKSFMRGSMPFIRDKALTIVYPYFLWSMISIALNFMAAHAVNNAIPLRAILTLWAAPVLQYWFLYALFLFQMLTVVTRANAWLTVLLCLMSAVGLSMGQRGIIVIASQYYVYFGLGVLVGPFIGAFSSAPLRVGVMTAVASAFFVISFVLKMSDSQGVFVARALLGIAATVGVSILVARRARWLAQLGMASMAIFVLHTVFSSGLRMGFKLVHLSDYRSLLLLSTGLGLAAPYIIWTLARHFNLVAALGLGAAPRLVSEARA